jgi:phosphatidylserine decarboxylase
VRAVEALADADSADAVMLAEPMTGSADETRAELESLTKHLNPGGVVSVSVAAAPFLAGGAGEELSRQGTLFGVGADVVLRSMPPLRVYRLRYTPAEAGLAERLAPLARTSSIRLSPDMNIDSNGVAAAAICLGAAVIARRLRPRSRLWLLPALAAAPVAAFFRDPTRDVPTDPAAIVAASDGKVLSVEHTRDDRLGGEEFLRIAVFLSVLDVHVNRAPVAGRVVDHFVVDGGFAAAMKPEAEHNVAAYTVLETTRGAVAVAQRTGLIARRIVHRSPVGSLLAKGERFGLIRFGSRTDVYLPVDQATALVATGRPGARRRDGYRPLDRLSEEGGAPCLTRSAVKGAPLNTCRRAEIVSEPGRAVLGARPGAPEEPEQRSADKVTDDHRKERPWHTDHGADRRHYPSHSGSRSTRTSLRYGNELTIASPYRATKATCTLAGRAGPISMFSASTAAAMVVGTPREVRAVLGRDVEAGEPDRRADRDQRACRCSQHRACAFGNEPQVGHDAGSHPERAQVLPASQVARQTGWPR